MKPNAILFGCILLSATAALAQQFPRVDTALVLDAADGTPADGASWRMWPVSSPSQVIASGAGDAVGLVRRDAAWIDYVDASAPGERVVAVETDVADTTAPAGRAGVFAVQRTSAAARLSVLPAMRLVRTVAPRASAAPGTVSIDIDPALADGVPLLAAQGLQGWQVLRSPDGLDAFTVVGSVAASATTVTFADVPAAGTWLYAVRPVFVPDVEALHASPASAPVAFVPSSCPEPSALDRFPGATPLLVERSGADVRLTWETIPSVEFDVYRGTLGALRAGSNDLVATSACRVRDAFAVVSAGSADVLLVAARCGGAMSSLGRRTDGTERSAPSAPCP